MALEHQWWRCQGPRERPRPVLRWDGGDGFRFPRMRRGKRFAARMNTAGGGAYTRMRLSGRVSADGTVINRETDLGIEGRRFSPGAGLSHEVAHALPTVVQAVLDEVDRIADLVAEHPDGADNVGGGRVR